MTESKRHHEKSLEDLKKIPEIQAALDYGIDVKMLIDNLKRSSEERIRRHQIALETVRELKKAKHKR